MQCDLRGGGGGQHGVRLKACMRFSEDHEACRDDLNENQTATLMHSDALNSVWRDKIVILMIEDFSTTFLCQSRERQNYYKEIWQKMDITGRTSSIDAVGFDWQIPSHCFLSRRQMKLSSTARCD